MSLGGGPAVPILRMFDSTQTLPFYTDYLGFSLDWEHRFEPSLPLYAQVSRWDITLHLSEHHGDGTMGGAVWIPVADVEALHEELLDQQHPRSRPGLDEDAPGGPTLTVIDPNGNELRFAQRTRLADGRWRPE